jgi:S-adenosylmethionine hydrolase
MSSSHRPIVFLTDFGLEDEFVGVCRTVIDRVAPEVKVTDLTHGVAPGDIRRGALALAAAVGYAAPSVFLAVVDPGVGTDRRAVALSAGDHFLVGPDNGLLWLAAERAGGVESAVDISNSRARLEPTMRTFHGRDIFSPVAARLAGGEDISGLGEEIGPELLTTLALPVPGIGEGSVTATVLAADRYGNLLLNVGPDDLENSFLKHGMRVSLDQLAIDEAAAVGDRDPGETTPDETTTGSAGRGLREVPFVAAFGEVEPGEALLYPDSSGALSLAVNRGDASAVFELGPDDRIRLRPA